MAKRVKKDPRAGADNLLHLMQLTSDWYWEQDAALRFTVVRRQGEAKPCGAEEDALGKRFGELGGVEARAEVWARYESAVAACRLFRDLVLTLRERDGGARTVSFSGVPIIDEAFGFSGYRGVARDITGERHAEAALRAVIERSPIYTFDLDGIVTMWNAAAARMFGWSEAEAVGQFLPFVQEEKREEFAALRERYRRGEMLTNAELLRRRRDGAFIEISVSTALLHDAAGRPTGVVEMALDISERKQVERRGAMEHAVARILAESSNAPEAIPQILQTICAALGLDYGAFWMYSKKTQRVKCVDVWTVPALAGTEFVAWTRRTHHTPGSRGLVRRTWHDKTPTWIADLTNDDSFDRAALARAVGLRTAFTFPIMIEGECPGVMEFFSFNARQPDEGLLQTIQATGSQIGQFWQRKEAEEHIRHLAYYDALTGLANRSLFQQHLDGALVRAQRHGRQFGILYVDLDGFKNVNDSLGHAAGDRLLREIARRLQSGVRASDTLTRQGGDEFIVLLEELGATEGAATVARHLLEAIAQPVLIDGHECRVTASIGISTYPADGADAQTLLQRADAAMYRAKEAGKNNYRFHAV